MKHLTFFASLKAVVLTCLVAVAFCRGEISLYSPDPAPRLRILFDYYHHVKPNTKVGDHLITGAWASNVGRYGWDDFAHTNSFDPVFVALEKEHAIKILEAPFSEKTLSEADAVVIINPDSPQLVPGIPVITDEELANLVSFVREGGSLMVLINSGGHSSEKFEEKQLRKLINTFGLDWNSDDTHYSDVPLGLDHPYFYDVDVFHYGAGCTIKIADSAERPVVLMEVASDPTYPERDVKGPGIVMVRPGKGKVFLVGDTGSWGANVSRPWAENLIIMNQLFRYLKPDNGVTPYEPAAGTTAEYEVTLAGLSAMDFNNNTLTDIARPHHRMFRPRPKTALPYLEATTSLKLVTTGVTAKQARVYTGTLDGFSWFDQSADEGEQRLTLTVGRQGKIADVDATGANAEFIAADLGALFALLPNDGIRIGDRWESIEQLRIPTLQGSDVPRTRPVEMEINYVRDELINGVECRLLRTGTEVWLDRIGVEIEDVLPRAQLRQWGGPDYAFFAGRGGTLLVRREQWVDKATGQVVKAKTQSRIVAWIHDTRKPVPDSPADKDKQMVTSFAHIVTFTKQ